MKIENKILYKIEIETFCIYVKECHKLAAYINNFKMNTKTWDENQN